MVAAPRGTIWRGGGEQLMDDIYLAIAAAVLYWPVGIAILLFIFCIYEWIRHHIRRPRG